MVDKQELDNVIADLKKELLDDGQRNQGLTEHGIEVALQLYGIGQERLPPR